MVDDLPVVVAEVGDSGQVEVMKKLYGEAFGYEPGPDGSTWRNGAIIFAAQQAFVEGDGNAALVRSAGLSFEPDAIHFDAAGLVELTSVPQFQVHASASCGRSGSGGACVVNSSCSGRRSKMLSCSTWSI